MIDHATIRVSNFEKSKAFYERALKPIGYKVIMEFDVEGMKVAGLGRERPDLWITTGSPKTGHVHLAFFAENEDAIQSFYDAALAAGGKDNGKPGPRPEYSATYFGAFVLDPDGNNIEAMKR